MYSRPILTIFVVKWSVSIPAFGNYHVLAYIKVIFDWCSSEGCQPPKTS